MVLIDFIIVLLRNLRKILAFSFGLGAVLFLLATVLPKSYKAKSIAVIAVGSDQGFGGIASMVSDLPVPSFLKGGLGGSGKEIDLIKTIIESDDLKYTLIHHFKYDSIYSGRSWKKKSKPRELILKAFSSYFTTEISNENAIKITMTDRSPQRAADVANYAISVTDSILNHLAIDNAKKRVEFFEEQIQSQRARMNIAEDAIRQYQERNKVALPQEQGEATMEASIDLDAKVMGAEVNLGLLRQKFQEDHPQIIVAKEYLTQLKRKRNEMVRSNPDNIFMPLERLPRTIVEYGRLMRDYKIQAAVFQTLLPELESAKLEQYKNIPSLQFVQRAHAAQRRSSPPRFVWTMLGLGFGFCTYVLWLCFQSYRNFLLKNDTQKANLLTEVITALKSAFCFPVWK